MRIEELRDAFLSDARHRLRLRPATVRAYGYDLRLAAAALPQPLDAITARQIEDYLAEHEHGTATRRAASLRRFFRWAVREGHCRANPLDGIEPRRGERRLPRPIRGDADRSTVDGVIAQAPQPHRLILTILRETGMRIGEVLALRLGDVCLDAGREGLRVREAKNHVERTVVLGPTATPKSLRALRAHVRTLKGQPDHAPLFRSNRGTALTYAAIYKGWGQLCIEAGLVDDTGKPRYTLHQLRHTRGTELIEQGQRVEIV